MTTQNVQTAEPAPAPTVSVSTGGGQQPSTPPVASSEQKSKLPDTLTTLLITVVAYLSVFGFESGYCGYFNVPTELIRPDVSTFLLDGSIMLALLFVVFYTWQFYFAFVGDVDDEKRPVVRPLSRFILVNLFMALLLLAERAKTLGWCLYGGFGFLYVLYKFITPYYLAKKNKTTYNESFKKLGTNRSNATPPSLYGELCKRGYGQFLNAFMCLGISYFFCSFVGGEYAAIKPSYLVRDTPRKELVIRVYGTTAITARMDDQFKVYSDFRVIKLEDNTNDFTVKYFKPIPQVPVKR